jgi:hypothetical protein
MIEEHPEGITLTAVALTPQDGRNGHRTPITRLCALERLFEARGTVEVKVGARTLDIPIKAVSTEEVEALGKPFRPVPPTRSQLEQGKRIIVQDLANSDYQEKLADYNRLSSYIYVLLALDIDVLDEAQRVVWSADNSVHDVEAGRRVLKHMGIVDNQLITILNAAAALTRGQEEVNALE